MITKHVTMDTPNAKYHELIKITETREKFPLRNICSELLSNILYRSVVFCLFGSFHMLFPISST